MVRTTRSRQTAKQRQAQKHKEYMTKYRSNEAYAKRELKERVLRRVAKGAVPTIGSMAKYDITLEDTDLMWMYYSTP